jgi:hypothetical protein
MTKSSILLKLFAIAPEKPVAPQYNLDYNSLAIAARIDEGWHLYAAFSYDTSTEGGLPGLCSLILPEAEDSDVVRMLRSGVELGGYRFGESLDVVDLTTLLGSAARFETSITDSKDPLLLARVITLEESYEIKIKGNLVELRGAGIQENSGQ